MMLYTFVHSEGGCAVALPPAATIREHQQKTTLALNLHLYQAEKLWVETAFENQLYPAIQFEVNLFITKTNNSNRFTRKLTASTVNKVGNNN